MNNIIIKHAKNNKISLSWAAPVAHGARGRAARARCGLCKCMGLVESDCGSFLYGLRATGETPAVKCCGVPRMRVTLGFLITEA